MVLESEEGSFEQKLKVLVAFLSEQIYFATGKSRFLLFYMIDPKFLTIEKSEIAKFLKI